MCTLKYIDFDIWKQMKIKKKILMDIVPILRLKKAAL